MHGVFAGMVVESAPLPFSSGKMDPLFGWNAAFLAWFEFPERYGLSLLTGPHGQHERPVPRLLFTTILASSILCIDIVAMKDSTPESLLPLPAAVFHILIALADRDRHGYSVMQEVAASTGGKMRLSAGTLYSSIRRMLEQGLIDELTESPDPSSTDERRRYYRLTRFGKRVAAAEVERLNALLQQARATGLVPGA